jgi:hypothetical protein
MGMSNCISSFQHYYLRIPHGVDELFEYIEKEEYKPDWYDDLKKISAELNLKTVNDTVYVYWFGPDHHDGNMTKIKSIYNAHGDKTFDWSFLFSSYDMVLGGYHVLQPCDFWSERFRFYYQGSWNTNSPLSFYVGEKIISAMISCKVLDDERLLHPILNSKLMLRNLLWHPTGPHPVNLDDEEYGRIIYYLKQNSQKKFDITRFNCGNMNIYRNMDDFYLKIDSCIQTLQIDTIPAMFFSVRPYYIYNYYGELPE